MDLLSDVNGISVHLDIYNEILYSIWKPPSQSELTTFIFDTELTHLSLETFI